VPQEVSEISSGAQFSRSSNEGQLADTQTRVFRILRSSADETVDIQAACNVKIGDQHPYNLNLYCVSFDARFEGDSRMVVAATFNYQSTASAGSSSGGADPRSQPPDVRPANWTTSTSLVEVPVSTWHRRIGIERWGDEEEPAANPVGDIYDGVTKLAPVVTISIKQFNATDPTVNLQYAGCVNSEQIVIGNLTMKPSTVLFRGISYEPVVESWGGRTFRGWSATYEFAYRQNPTKVWTGVDFFPGGGPKSETAVVVDLGWDIAVPVTGFNVRAVAPSAEVSPAIDIFGQPLAHYEGKVTRGSFSPEGVFTPNELFDYQLPFGTKTGDRVRAMVKVFDYESGGTAQAPSASPIALRWPNGEALMTRDENGERLFDPYVIPYRTQPAINLTATLNLRLQ